MALLAAAGARLRLIAVTDGEASHPAADQDAIARPDRRVAHALRALGVHDIEVIRLRFPDTGLAAREDSWPPGWPGCAPGSACAWRPGKPTLTPITRLRAAPRGGPSASFPDPRS